MPNCWMNGGCTTEKPDYDFLNVHDYENKFNLGWEYYEKGTTACQWQKCSGDTLVYNRDCGIDGICGSYGNTYNCKK